MSQTAIHAKGHWSQRWAKGPRHKGHLTQRFKELIAVTPMRHRHLAGSWDWGASGRVRARETLKCPDAPALANRACFSVDADRKLDYRLSRKVPGQASHQPADVVRRYSAAALAPTVVSPRSV